MRTLFMINLFVTLLLFSCTNDKTKTGVTRVPTGFYFLAENEQGIKMHLDHSNEDYNISQKPFVSVKNILRASAQKNIIDGRITYGVNIVLDNEGTKYLEEATGNSSHPYFAVVIANRLLYVVKNISKIKTGLMQIILVDYTETEIDEMINAISQKK